MRGLVNAGGNFMVIDRVDFYNVTVSIYESKEKYDSGLDNNFEKVVVKSLHLGSDLEEGVKTTTAYGTGGRTIFDNLVTLCEDIIAAQAAENAERHIHEGIDGAWTIYAA